MLSGLGTLRPGLHLNAASHLPGDDVVVESRRTGYFRIRPHGKHRLARMAPSEYPDNMADDKSKVSMPDRNRLSRLQDYEWAYELLKLHHEFPRGLLKEWLARA